MFKRVLITDKKVIERLSITNKEDYEIHRQLRKGHFYELVALPEYQVKPYFDLDPRGEFDYKIFDKFEEDLKKIIDLPIYSCGRKQRIEEEILKHSRRYYIKARITFYNILVVFKEIFDKYKDITDVTVYDNKRRFMLPLTNMKFDKKVPQMKLIKGDIFDNCATYIEEDYENLDLRVVKKELSDVDKLLRKFNDIDIKDDDNDNDKYNKLQKLITLMKEKRSTNYQTWINVCWAIMNICNQEKINDIKMRRLIHKFSTLSTSNYNEDKVDKWIDNNFKLLRKETYGWNYLYQTCIKEDAPDYYNKLTQSYYNLKIEFEKKNSKIMYPPQIISLDNDDRFQIQKIDNAIKSFSHIKCYINEENKKGEKVSNKKKFIFQWLEDPYIRIYDTNVFKPPPLIVKKHEHNCWIDFSIINKPLIKTDRDFFKEWCEFAYNLFDNKSYADFMIARYAQRIQTPAKRTFVCVVYYGEERIGKNRWLSPIKKIMDKYYQELDNASKLYDKHSMYEFQTLMICINEANGIENFQNADILKTRITEPDVSVNPKGIQAYQVENYCDYDMTTNNKHVVKITDGSFNRFFQVECSNYYQGNVEFFNDYIANIENNLIAIRQIYEGLMNFDIKAVIPTGNFQNDKPLTEVEEEIKEQNRDNIILFLEDYCRDYIRNDKRDKFEIKRYVNQKLFEMWGDWLKKCNINAYLTKQKFGMKLMDINKKIFKNDTIKKDKSNGITYIDTQKLASYFKLEDLFIEEDD